MRDTTGGDPAYVMFTSGSTGFPKGAVMSHANVLNFIRWSRETLEVTPDDVLTNVNPMYFDNSVFDFYTALFNGATLCPLKADPSGGGMRDLVKAINRLGCTIWFSVPSLLVYLLITKAIGKDDFPGITRFVFGGEGFPKPKLAQLHDLYGHRARLVNVYGPTECTCICSSYDITERDLENQTDLAPLGRIAPNFDYVIDTPDPANPDFGELLLAGPNVGLGYFGDPERTRKSFVQDPTESRYTRIVYRTGDLVLRDENGYLHFRGRADNQIKHMGYRIELEEIEAGLNSLEYVEEAAVVYVRQSVVAGRIVAFVNAPTGVQPGEVTEDIRRIVPPYMVPNDMHVMGALPKNRNGKIDRVRLREQIQEAVKS
jgi:D-alanine--poly(phosphoribitol) ligase subunit 1